MYGLSKIWKIPLSHGNGLVYKTEINLKSVEKIPILPKFFVVVYCTNLFFMPPTQKDSVWSTMLINIEHYVWRKENEQQTGQG